MEIDNTYLFSWDEIPGNDDERIIEFLKDELKIEWAKTENISKIDDGKTIIVSNKEKSLSLKLNDEKTKVNLKIDDGRVHEFTVKTENGKLNIYDSTYETIYVPISVEETADNSWEDISLLSSEAKNDQGLTDFLDSMPHNYFTLFSPQEIIEHYHFIKRNTLGESGTLPDDTNLEIRNSHYILMICKKDLSSFHNLIKKTEMSNKQIVHHHTFFPKSGDFQIIFIQTTDEHFEPKQESEPEKTDELKNILSVKIDMEKRIIKENFLVESNEKIISSGSLEYHINSGCFGTPDDVMDALTHEFYPNLNVAYKKGMDRGKIAELAILYLQLKMKNIDSLCYIRKTHNNLLKVNCFGKSPSYTKSQRYLSFLAGRLKMYQNLNDESQFEYLGGFSNFIKSSDKEHIEMLVFYLEPMDINMSCAEDYENINLEKELTMDLTSRVVPRFNDLSLFDILGPVMIGPSSSHTAGANRLGRLARNIIAAGIESKKLAKPLFLAANLFSSFRLTGPGHGTPNAILGGLRGFDEADERISNETTNSTNVDEIEICDENIAWCGYVDSDFLNETYHENSVVFMVNNSNNFSDFKDVLLYIVGESYGGGNIQICEIGGLIVPEVLHFDTKTREEFTGKQVEKLPTIFDNAAISPIFDYPPPEAKGIPEDIKRPRIVELNDILWYSEKTGTKISQMALEYECTTQGIKKELYVRENIEKIIHVMNECVSDAMEEDQKKYEFFGGDGVLLNKFTNRNSHNTEQLFLKASAFAIGVSEQNAAHKKVVAAPTAGASGIVPGVLTALDETYNFSPQEKRSGLLTAAFIGLVINNIVPTAGATHGCQAETGVGCAMAAAMATDMLGGNTEQIINATALALKNSLGLVCDPIGGKVEVPCIKRNGFKAVEALVAAKMALSGITSAVSASEIVKAMDEIGNNMKNIYKETSEGGLARTIRGRDGEIHRNHCGICYNKGIR